MYYLLTPLILFYFMTVQIMEDFKVLRIMKWRFCSLMAITVEGRYVTFNVKICYFLVSWNNNTNGS